MMEITVSEITKSGFQLPTGKSMIQYTIETLQSFVSCIDERETEELDWNFLQCLSNIFHSLAFCAYNYERFVQEVIEDVDEKKGRLLLSFNKSRFGSLHFLEWDERKVSETISDIINRSPLFLELKRQFDNRIIDGVRLNDILPRPENYVIVNIEDIAETFCEIRNGFLQAYPPLRLQSETSTEQKDVPEPEQEPSSTILPPELDTPDAHLIWSKAKHNGWINEDYSFNGTRYQMAYAAEIMSKSLNLKYKWKPFEILWDYKYFAQTRRESNEEIGKVERDRDIEKSFSL